MDFTSSIQSVTFSGHESFPLRFAWLAKAVQHCANDPSIFVRDDAVVRLGVGKNMVRSMRHWAQRSGMIESEEPNGRGGRYTPTELGRLLFSEPDGRDPYLEDSATVWVVHWGLASSPSRSPTTWFYLLNLLREQSFTIPEAVDQLVRFAEPLPGKSPNRRTIERDIHCFVRSYDRYEPDRKISREETYDSPLADLNILRMEPESDRLILERSERPTLPSSVFAFAIADYWARVDTGGQTLTFEEIAYAPGSPGQVFKLSENALVHLLESLRAVTGGKLSYDGTSGIRQIVRKAKSVPRQLQFLMRHYSADTKEFACA